MSLLSTPVSKALVEELERCFPVRRPTPEDTFNAVLYESGQRHVVEFIRAGYEAQQNSHSIFKAPELNLE